MTNQITTRTKRPATDWAGRGGLPNKDIIPEAEAAYSLENEQKFRENVRRELDNLRRIINKGSDAADAARDRLTANRTYFVRPDGNDANNGLTNTAAGAFLTVQKALDVVSSKVDLAGWNVDIQLADSTAYVGGTMDTPQVGDGLITLRGNAVTPTNVRITHTGAGGAGSELLGAVVVSNSAKLQVQDLELRATTSGQCLAALAGGTIYWQNVTFGAAADAHIFCTGPSFAKAVGNYTVSGGAARHWWANALGEIRVQSKTLTISGTPAFSVAFAVADYSGVCTVNGNLYSAAATGVRFLADYDGVIIVSGASDAVLPGNATGVRAHGGQYDGYERSEFVGVNTFWGFEARQANPIFSDTPLQVHVGSITDAAEALFYWANDSTGVKGTYFKSRGANPGTHGLVQSGDIVGGLEFFASDGAAWREVGRAQFEVDGTAAANDVRGRYVVRTSPGGGAAPIERTRVGRGGAASFWGAATPGASGVSLNVPVQGHGTSEAGSTNTIVGVYYWGNDNVQSRIEFNKSRNDTIGFHTIVQAEDFIGSLDFLGSSGGGHVRGAAMRVIVDGTPGASNDMPMRWSVWTSPDGSATIAESLRVSNGGLTYFPRLNTTASAANAFLNSGSTPVNELLRSTSSIRYKKDVEDLDVEFADNLLQLRPVWYRSTSKADREDWSWYGLIAEEVANIDPRLVQWGYPDEAFDEVEVAEPPRLLETEAGFRMQPGEKELHRRLKPGAQMVPDGVTYDRLAVLLLSVVQRMSARLVATEAKLATFNAPGKP